MTDELKPVRCGCGGEPVVGHIKKTSYLPKDRWYIGCPKCDICTGIYDTEAEAITTWNKAMGERTEKAEWSEPDGCYLCGGCGRQVEEIDSYCAECGVRLDWSE